MLKFHTFWVLYLVEYDPGLEIYPGRYGNNTIIKAKLFLNRRQNTLEYIQNPCLIQRNRCNTYFHKQVSYHTTKLTLDTVVSTVIIWSLWASFGSLLLRDSDAAARTIPRTFRTSFRLAHSGVVLQT